MAKLPLQQRPADSALGVAAGSQCSEKYPGLASPALKVPPAETWAQRNPMLSDAKSTIPPSSMPNDSTPQQRLIPKHRESKVLAPNCRNTSFPTAAFNQLANTFRLRSLSLSELSHVSNWTARLGKQNARASLPVVREAALAPTPKPKHVLLVREGEEPHASRPPQASAGSYLQARRPQWCIKGSRPWGASLTDFSLMRQRHRPRNWRGC